MPLPVLPARRSNADLLRLFSRTEYLRGDPLGEATELQTGTVRTNSQLPTVAMANRVMDAAIPAGWSAASALAEVTDHFARQGLVCREWWLNPSQPNALLADALITAAYRAQTIDIFCLASPARPMEPPGHGVSVYSARAALSQARALAEEITADSTNPAESADAIVLQLDDPHYELLVAGRAGEPAGLVGVLSAGDLGRIDHFFVHAGVENEVAPLLLNRAIELGARSRFLDLLATPGRNAELFAAAEFRSIGKLTYYENLT